MNIAEQILTELRRELIQYEDPQQAKMMAAYMRTNEPFRGIQSTLRREILRRILSPYRIMNDYDYAESVTLLWNSPGREEKYCAIDVALKYKKQITPDKIVLFESMLLSANNRDTVDIIAANLVGPLLIKDKSLESYLLDWSTSENLWMRRSAILAQLKLKEKTNIPLHFSLMEKMLPEYEMKKRISNKDH